MSRLLLVVLLVLSSIELANSIKCFIGYGERGLKSKHEIVWTRDCPSTLYCWEVVTTDITKVQQLIDFPWVRHPFIVILTVIIL